MRKERTHRICDINKRHRTAMTFPLQNIWEETSIRSAQPGETYHVNKKLETWGCKLKCRFCSVCPHMYTCTCLDACTNTTACMYMHIMYMQNTPASPLIPSNTTTEDHLAYYVRATGITSEAVFAVFAVFAVPLNEYNTTKPTSARRWSIYSRHVRWKVMCVCVWA